ncbi:MAG: hypothetical protein A2840_01510 [Candidatus Buchananbacteria bacterium RIFCSPHIGHO2_01_FULL_47_11b]|uniref:Phospholipid/glycerol acyltransferase domain-containing protein n=1 Tax=Candidatus Buchananbacteria bacterium RIFCSPHIGHO2_01_FULL_47_11b TaxID=1797537 RepID=A0A1G1Y3I0_9BACT|nr:MAG: hypothetical protein A2840_01510 [Candidatus Buchananbacteria bacterium RIFCSPHIGHO2_01_FULL_47_11b]
MFRPLILWLTNLGSYVWIAATTPVFWVFMYVLNKTVVVNRRLLPHQPNVLIISNHLTMIDSWFIGIALFWPWVLLRPELTPWHVPERKNFFKNRALALLFRFWKCMPITRGSGDFLTKLTQLGAELKKSSLIIFPEGTRNRNPKSGQLYAWRGGPTLIAHRNQAMVVPVAIRGTEDVLPIGSVWPKFGQRIVVVVGEPIDTADIYAETDEQHARNILSTRMKETLQRLLTEATALYENKT